MDIPTVIGIELAPGARQSGFCCLGIRLRGPVSSTRLRAVRRGDATSLRRGSRGSGLVRRAKSKAPEAAV